MLTTMTMTTRMMTMKIIMMMLTVGQALGMCMGGAPAGPAGGIPQS